MTLTISDIPEDELAGRAGTMFMEVLRRTHLSTASDLSTVVAEEARRIGIDAAVLYLVDYEQTVLVPVPGPDTANRDVLAVQATLGGRSFSAGTILDTEADGGRRVWLPLLDGTERLGVIELVTTGAPEELSEAALTVCERYAHLIAGLIVTKDAYSDAFKLLRRRRGLTTASELLRDMVAPSTLATDKFVLGALLEPAYDIGGDAYDYAINDGVLHLGIFDGVGHGLAAAGVTTFALAVYRHGRRCGQTLTEMYEAIDAELADQYPTTRYVTACLATLDVTTGRLRWISAGHPAPLLLRRGRFIRELDVKPSPPMGLKLAEREPVIGDESLEPGDMVLFYTDGLTESRRPDGRLFTTERLAEFIERQAASGEAAPETLRRLREAIIERGEGSLRDDATAMLLEWSGDTQDRLLPQTVLSSGPPG
jgi:serine/threonine protein phosphatase PrpC